MCRSNDLLQQGFTNGLWQTHATSIKCFKSSLFICEIVVFESTFPMHIPGKNFKKCTSKSHK